MPSEVQQLNDEAGSYRIDEIQELPIQMCSIHPPSPSILSLCAVIGQSISVISRSSHFLREN